MEFHDMVLHILENVHATFSAADMLALGCLINEYDKNGSETLDIVEFNALASDLVKKNFLFTGREGPDTLDLNQLYVLREYNWKRRKMQKLEEGTNDAEAGGENKLEDNGPQVVYDPLVGPGLRREERVHLLPEPPFGPWRKGPADGQVQVGQRGARAPRQQ